MRNVDTQMQIWSFKTASVDVSKLKGCCLQALLSSAQNMLIGTLVYDTELHVWHVPLAPGLILTPCTA